MLASCVQSCSSVRITRLCMSPNVSQGCCALPQDLGQDIHLNRHRVCCFQTEWPQVSPNRAWGSLLTSLLLLSLLPLRTSERILTLGVVLATFMTSHRRSAAPSPRGLPGRPPVDPHCSGISGLPGPLHCSSVHRLPRERSVSTLGLYMLRPSNEVPDSW